MKVATEFFVEPMRLEDIPAVHAIERVSFPQAWPQNAYRREILENRMARYVVVRQAGGDDPDEPVESAVVPVAPSPGLFDRVTRFFRAGNEAGSESGPVSSRGVVGYAGMWVMVDEAHITTIASHTSVRGRGVGELLLVALLRGAMDLHARWVTLEVRRTNSVAQNLYHKYTFREMGVRRRYYSDNGEDALVMWTDALDSESFLEAFERNHQRLTERLGELRLAGSVSPMSHTGG